MKRMRKVEKSGTSRRERYSHALADEAKKKRRMQADELAEVRAKRTDEQQLAKLDAGGYAATKERKRLQARIDRKKRSIKKG